MLIGLSFDEKHRFLACQISVETHLHQNFMKDPHESGKHQMKMP